MLFAISWKALPLLKSKMQPSITPEKLMSTLTIMRENSTVEAEINNSTLTSKEKGAVNVNAENDSEVKADGGFAAVSINVDLYSFLASLGSATAITNATFDNKVTADVDSSTINAAGDVNINARDDDKSKETVVAAAASTGLGVSVNRMSTSINSGLGNLEANQLGKTVSSSDLVMIKPQSRSAIIRR